jgi:L-ribulokinase
MRGKKFSLGLDFGTNSVRALLVEVKSGREVAESVWSYRRGEAGVLLDPRDDNLARQDPQDWLDGLEQSTRAALRLAGKKVPGFSAADVIGIGVDTTGSTPLPLDRAGRPLGLLPAFRKNLSALAWLWKDHTSFAEAAEITALAQKLRPQYLKKCGGAYSSEWFFSKILHCRRVAPQVFAAAFSWAECSDYIPAVLTGRTDPLRMKRNLCAAGHKAMYNSGWGGLPDQSFLSRLDPDLGKLRPRLYDLAYPADLPAGPLAPAVAKRLLLPSGIPVAVGVIDAHAGAVGSGIKPGVLVKIIGTSTCDMMVAPLARTVPDIPGIAGIAEGSILPGASGFEAGQSAVGDIFNWFVASLAPQGLGHAELTGRAKKLQPGESGLLALDWNNGNRNVLADPRLTGLLLGQTLRSAPEEIYRALIEATAFGARMIIERFEACGMRVKEVVNCGGISEKNDLLLQIYADVLGRPMKLARSTQACALGAAIFGAVAAGARLGGHATVEAAERAMTGLKPQVFRPVAKNQKVYNQLFGLYRQIHDSFGGVVQAAKLGGVMKELLRIKESAQK